LFYAVFNTIAPVVVCALVGYIWARRVGGYEIAFVTRIVTLIGMPALVFETLIKVDLTAEALLKLGASALVSTGLFALISFVVLRAAKLEVRTYLPSLTFANTGNMGLSLCLLAFGAPGLAMAIGYFTVNAILVFGLGPSIAAGRFDIRAVMRMPLVWATALAIVVMAADIELPAWTMSSLNMLGSFAIPLMLITLGVSLADLKVQGMGLSISLAVLRLGMGFGVGLGVAELFGFEGMARGVVIIECAMPAAVFNFMFAKMYETRPAEVAGVIMVSTLLSFLTLPALMWFVMGG
jgi:predicted permease